MDVCETTIDSTICIHTCHTTDKLIGAGLNRKCTGNPLTDRNIIIIHTDKGESNSETSKIGKSHKASNTQCISRIITGPAVTGLIGCSQKHFCRHYPSENGDLHVQKGSWNMATSHAEQSLMVVKVTVSVSRNSAKFKSLNKA